MNRHSPLAANLGNPGHWNPGQRLIYISPGVANRIKSEELADVTLDEAFVLQLPLDPSPSDLVQIARSAHEIWILQGEAFGNPPFELLLKFRSQSIPVSAGERRSVLHAPELGIVRLFDVASAGDLVCQKVLLPLGEAERTLDAAWADMRTFAKRIASIEGNSVACTPADAQPSRSLPTSTLEQLRIASLQSAWQDDRSVRWVLASLFAVTVVGVVLLQAMATAGWSVPMADIYAVFFMLVGSAYIWARKHHLNDRQWLYRLIAQTIEIHLLWHRASLNEPVAVHFQLRHHASLKWVRELLRFTFLTASRNGNSLSSKSVLGDWLPSSISTNEALANWHASRAKRMTLAVYFCYGLSGLLTLWMVLGTPLTGWPDVALGSALGIASSIGTLFLIFGGTLGYSANAALYRHLSQLLQRAHQSLALDLPDHEYDELLIDTGRECIQAAVERAFQ